MSHLKSRRAAKALAALLAVVAFPAVAPDAQALPVHLPAFALPSGAPVLAQGSTTPGESEGGGYGEEPSVDDGDGGDDPVARRGSTGGPTIVSAAAPASAAATALIVARVSSIENVCEKLPELYSVDCLAREIAELARDLPKRGDYADAQAALDRVAGELAQISRANADRAKPRVSVRVQRPGERQPAQTAPIAAVRPERLEAAQAEAAQAIQSLQVELLRSVPETDPRQVHYQRIAAAFDSSVVLLRS
jgi:hypothetical protein